MKLYELSKLTLPEVHQKVTREQLIIMISNQQLSKCISYCNHFHLNGIELAEVISRYNNSGAMKMELIKGLIVHCPQSRSDYFTEKSLAICESLLDDHSGNKMTSRMYVSIFKHLAKHFPEKFTDVALLKKSAHFRYNQEDYTILDVVLKHEIIGVEDLQKVFNRNPLLNTWFTRMDESKLKTLPAKYHDCIMRHKNRLKLNGSI